MSIRVFWTLPPRGDGRSALRTRWQRGDWNSPARPGFVGLTDARGGRYTYFDHLAQVARAAEVAGASGVLIPWDPAGEDPWIVASSLAREARKLVFLPELLPGFATPVYLAKMSVSFQRLSKNRLAWKLDVERDIEVRRAHGDFLEGRDWFERADEYLEAAKGVWSTHPFNFEGRFYSVEAGGFEGPLAGRPLPPVYTSGQSDDALALAAKHADVHLLEPGSIDATRHELTRLGAAARRVGRTVRGGLRLAILARHTEEEAWGALRDAWSEANIDESVNQFLLQPNVWAGFGRLGGDADVGLVGSYDAVAERLLQYAALGIGDFILSANPHLEEVYRLGEHVLPRVYRSVQRAAYAV